MHATDLRETHMLAGTRRHHGRQDAVVKSHRWRPALPKAHKAINRVAVCVMTYIAQTLPRTSDAAECAYLSSGVASNTAPRLARASRCIGPLWTCAMDSISRYT
jgi:hypothetical protein